MSDISQDQQLEYITASLEQVSEDLNPQIIERYQELCPDAVALMSHMDEYMCGRMLDEVFMVVLGAEDFESWIDFELTNHESYGVQVEMYTHLFAALNDVVKDHVGGAWRPEWQEAWASRINRLLTVIGRHRAA